MIHTGGSSYLVGRINSCGGLLGHLHHCHHNSLQFPLQRSGGGVFGILLAIHRRLQIKFTEASSLQMLPIVSLFVISQSQNVICFCWYECYNYVQVDIKHDVLWWKLEYFSRIKKGLLGKGDLIGGCEPCAIKGRFQEG